MNASPVRSALPVALAASALLLLLPACSSDDDGPLSCGPNEVERNGQCVPARPGGGGGSGGEPGGGDSDVHDGTSALPGDVSSSGGGPPGDTSGEPGGASSTTDAPPTQPPPGRCPPGEPVTTLTGVVTIPSMELPLPDVSVYVPSGPLVPIATGATCLPCGQPLSGFPIVETETNLNGQFILRGVPEGDNIPLVIEVGKWRREVTIPRVDPCQINQLPREMTRLPRNSSEGHIPQFAVTTGGCDALECLLRKIGIDDSEFTVPSEEGRVHLYAGRGGTDSFSGGPSFPSSMSWWDELDNLLPYDIIVHSCECNTNANDKSDRARRALQDFSDAGGRVFLSHLHYIWLSGGTDDFRAVADWGNSSSGISDNQTGIIDISFDKGTQLAAWMELTGNPGDTPGQFPIEEARGSIREINSDLATQWVSINPRCIGVLPGFGGGCPSTLTQYFSFNTPVFDDPADQCGRVVFSDIHVSAGDNSSPNRPFPTGCTSSGLTPQERALVFMLFDLARCIVPDKI
ncbi:MAG: carboxypeptidase regulatory-like domain-containing protein [Deltaproteobacteria bacterium]|nr:MAG: carboxypeptidase regulatory-like domain-containing protein [Deltaproteobacteria bacterium]